MVQKLRMKMYEPLEKEIQKSILDYLKARRVFCWKEHSSGIARPDGKGYIPSSMVGKSDIIGVYRGKFLAIEVKRKSGSLSLEQEYFLDRVKQEGGIAFVAYSIDDVVKNLL